MRRGRYIIVAAKEVTAMGEEWENEKGEKEEFVKFELY